MESLRRSSAGLADTTPDGGRKPVYDGLAACHCRGACKIDTAVFKLLHSHKITAAYRQAAAAIMENANCWRGHRAMGQVFDHLHRPPFAVEHHRRALAGHDAIPAERHPEMVVALNVELGQSLLRAGELVEARDRFRNALSILPAYLPAAGGLKECETKLTQRGERAHHGHALLDQGHELESRGDYAGAWSLYCQAKDQLKAQGYAYNATAANKRFDGYRAHCTRHTMARLSAIARSQTAKLGRAPWSPLFVLGYPRSGTTLLEQCLSRLEQVTAGDELPFLVELVNGSGRFFNSRAAYPWCLNELVLADTEIALENMRHHYLARVAERMGPITTPFVTDKMPLNETYLPLIHLLFPDAPCVLIRRNPLDVIVSNFSLFLTHGAHQACDVQSCLHHYRAAESLVEHYRAKMPAMRLKIIAYDALVNDPRATLTAICDFAGLGFSEAMLHPEESGRFCRTASFSQVREPINRKGVDRWRRFETQLRAALPAAAFP